MAIFKYIMKAKRIGWGVFFLIGMTVSLWSSAAADAVMGGNALYPPVIDGDRLFYSMVIEPDKSTERAAIVAVDKLGLDVIWSRVLPNTREAPRLCVDDDGNIIAIYGIDSLSPAFVVSIAGNDGEIKWVTEGPLDALRSVVVVGYEDRLFFKMQDSEGILTLRSVSTGDGSENWRVPIRGNEFSYQDWGYPTGDADLVFVDQENVFIVERGVGSSVSAFSVLDGSMSWTYSGISPVDMVPGANHDLVVLTELGTLISFDRASGKVLWRRGGYWADDQHLQNGTRSTAPLLVGSDGEVFAFSFEGDTVCSVVACMSAYKNVLWSLSGHNGRVLRRVEVFESQYFDDGIFWGAELLTDAMVGASGFQFVSGMAGFDVRDEMGSRKPAAKFWSTSKSGNLVGGVEEIDDEFAGPRYAVLDEGGKAYLNGHVLFGNLEKLIVQTDESGFANTPWPRLSGDLRNTGRIREVDHIYPWQALDMDPGNERLYGGINDDLRPWKGQTFDSYDGEDALMSDSIRNGEKSTFTIVANGPGTLRFFWRLTGDSGARLAVSNDGELVFEAEIYDEWVEGSVHVSLEEHVVEVSVSRSEDQPDGQSVGWLDEVSFEPEASRLIWTREYDFDGLEQPVVYDDHVVAVTSDYRIISIDEVGEIVRAGNEFLGDLSGISFGDYRAMIGDQSQLFYFRDTIQQLRPSTLPVRVYSNLTSFSMDFDVGWEFSGSWNYEDQNTYWVVAGPSLGYADELFAFLYHRVAEEPSRVIRQFIAFDRSSGGILFSRNDEFVNTIFGPQLLVASGRLFARGVGSIHALSSTDGELLWSTFIVGSVQSDGAVGDKAVFFVTRPTQDAEGTHGVMALSQNAGGILWQRDYDIAVTSSPIVSSEGYLVHATDDGMLRAVSGSNGANIWKSHVGGVVGTPILGADDNLYFVTYEGTVKAVDLFSGEEVWEYSVGSQSTFGPVMMRSGLMLVGFEGQFNGMSLYAFNTGSGGLGSDPWPKFMGDYGNTGRVQLQPVLRLSTATENGAKMLRIKRDAVKTTVVEYTSDFDEWKLFDSFGAGEDDAEISVENLPAETQRFFRSRKE